MIELSKSPRLVEAGEKARNLQWLLQKGYRIPRTYVLPFEYHAAFLKDSQPLIGRLRTQLAEKIEPARSYAVRSSANLEDTRQHSFAGQFCTFLNVRGMDALIQAVQGVWEATGFASILSYAQKSGQSLASLKMAVLIQEMVTPVFSGVSFSKNPLTGLNEIVIEAVQGSGEQLVQQGVNPERWVYRWGDWTIRPDASPIDPELLRRIAQETWQVAKQFGAPVDLEWVFDGEALHWVQLRPITQLEGINIYSNRISRETIPGFIKPLIWSINIPLVNTVWINQFTQMIGPNELKPEDLAKSFAYRAYFNMGTIGRIFELMGFPRESLEILLGLPGGSVKPRFTPSPRTISLLPRLLAFALSKLRLGSEILPNLAKIRSQVDAVLRRSPSDLDEPALLQAIDQLYTLVQKLAEYNVVVPMLMSIYNALLRRQIASLGVDYACFDLTYGLRELEEYDPNLHIRRAAQAFQTLDTGVQAQITSASYQDFTALPGIADLQAQVATIIERFGHLSDSGNDFSSVPWRETPQLVLHMVAAEGQRLSAPISPGLHVKTHFEVEQPAQSRETAPRITWQALPLSPLRRILLRPLYERARRFRLYREAVSAAYTYAYGLFRVCYRELARRFVARGVLKEIDDIFYLCAPEIAAAVSASQQAEGVHILAAERKAEMVLSQAIQLPETIYGDELPPLQALNQSGEDKFTGIPSSRGYYRGPAKVVRGLSDFGKLVPGDVLVIPFSDVSWTPLFTRAGAVIAESGGMLSHSSIVAREFNLPCVVSVPNACQIPDNTLVSVDGFKGEVVVLGVA
jgi:phosphohistidine swiveling domain-containing protein